MKEAEEPAGNRGMRAAAAASPEPAGPPVPSHPDMLHALVQVAADTVGARFAALIRVGPDGHGLEVVESVGLEKGALEALRAAEAPAAWRRLGEPWNSGEGRAEVPFLARTGASSCSVRPTAPAPDHGPLLLFGDARLPGDGETALLDALVRTAGSLALARDIAAPLTRAMEAVEGGITLVAARAPDMPLVYANERFSELTGFPPEEIVGRNCRFLQGGQRDQPGIDALRAAVAEGRECTALLHNVRRDGSGFWNEVHVAPIAGADGAPEWYVGVQRDVTERESLRAGLARERAEFRRILNESSNGVLVLDEDGAVLYANPAAEAMLGRPASELESESFGVPLDDRTGPTEITIKRDAHDGGRPGIAELSVTRTEWNGEPAWFAALHDVTARRHAEDAARRMAWTDPLTGLGNREFLREELEQAVITGAEEDGRCVGMLLLDMDRFKEINESLGHAEGDHFLIEVARRLQSNLRDNDLIARFGGDEFAVLLDRVKKVDSVTRVADKVVEAFHEPLQVGDRRIKASCSLGISLFPDDADTAAGVMKHADAAMYAAKRAGGSGYQMFRPDFVERAERRLAVDQGLADALAERQFVVQYQPQVALGGVPRLSGVEALVRWNHPERGLVPPGEFIEELEELDLIGELTRYVLDEVCRQIAVWSGGRRTPSALLNVSVNLSARELRSEELVSALAAIIDGHGIDPGRICFEVTESAAASDIVQATHTLGALRDLGARIALDDFGKGYSALNYLRVLPIDTVKIDREFIRDLPGDASSTAMIRAIVEMARGIDKHVLAEGVEYFGQHELLQEIGCDFAQGFLYGRPSPVDGLPTSDTIHLPGSDGS